MRLIWIALALGLAGCQPMTLSAGPPDPVSVPLGGGGGGGGLGPVPAVACPVDFSAALERAIAEVPDRRAQDSLLVQQRLLEKVVNASGPTEINSAAGAFVAMVNRLEAHSDVEPDLAGRLRSLVSCYQYN